MAYSTVFKYRKGWRGQAQDKAGKRHTKDFGKKADAKEWAASILSAEVSEHEPELGGPTMATLAETLRHYAGLYSVTKGGAEQELSRINMYLRGAGMALLKLRDKADGQQELVEVPAEAVDDEVAKGMRAHLAKRREKSARTFAFRAELAKKRVSTITKVELDRFVATMKADLASDSYIQKEIALLKAVLNKALERWNWVGFANPCIGIKLGGSEHRFVRVSKERLDALYQALSECDNPWFWPLVDCAIYMTARKSSLLKLTWDHVDLEGRCAVLRKAKTGTVRVPLSPRVIEVLSQLPRHESGRVFPMSANAVDMAWDGVRIKAGLKGLQFRDLRHVGATHYAPLVGAHVLRKVLGHKTLHMALVYVNMAEEDAAEHLAVAEQSATAKPKPALPAMQSTNPSRVSRKAQRLIEAARKRLAQAQAQQEAAGVETGALVFQFPSRPTNDKQDEPGQAVHAAGG